MSHLPEVPVVEPQADAPEVAEVPLRRPPSFGVRMIRAVAVFFGWVWRLAVGAAACQSLIGGVVAIGWLMRRSEAVVVKYWWKRSPHARPTSTGYRPRFTEYCDRLGPDAPVLRPRWLLRERIGEAVARPGASSGQVLLTLLTVPWHSIWRNLIVGAVGLAGTFALVGWGHLLMLVSWEFGWRNSFHKGYEIHFAGALLGILGILLVMAAMMVVPLAQAHFAVTRRLSAVFEVRLLLKLLRVKLWPSLALALVTVFAVAVPLAAAREALTFLGDSTERMSDAELARFLSIYNLYRGLFLFGALVVLRSWAARLYAGAVLTAVRCALVQEHELPPTIVGWLERLEVIPTPELRGAGVVRVAVDGLRFGGRTGLYAAIVMTWFFLVALGTYVPEFFNYHPIRGLLNEPVVLLPDVNDTPDPTQPRPLDEPGR